MTMLIYVSVALFAVGVASGDTAISSEKPSTSHLIRLQQNIEAQPKVYLYNPTTKPGDGSPNVEQVEGRKNDKLEAGGAEETGFYYIYHPNGLLQKVGYATKDDVMNMAFIARLRYTNVEAINGPIYTYDPQTYVFRKL